MKDLDFLNKLKIEGTLKLIEPSNEISDSYIIKSEKCIKVARLAFTAGIYENAISEAYYSIYNTLTSLFYKCGIKCENHSGAAILIKQLFKLERLSEIFSELKRDRIDNQYYVPLTNGEPVSKGECNKKIILAQKFNMELRAIIERITLQEMSQFRKRFQELF